MASCRNYLAVNGEKQLSVFTCPVMTSGGKDAFFIYTGDSPESIALLCEKKTDNQESALPVLIQTDGKADNPEQDPFPVSGGGYDFYHDSRRKKPGAPPSGGVFSLGILSQGEISAALLPFAFGTDLNLPDPTLFGDPQVYFHHELLSNNNEILVIGFHGQQRLYRMASPLTGWQLITQVNLEPAVNDGQEYITAEDKMSRALTAVFAWLGNEGFAGASIRQRPGQQPSTGAEPKDNNNTPAQSSQPAAGGNNLSIRNIPASVKGSGGGGDSEPPAQEGYKCHLCPESFSTEKELKDHKQKIHSLLPERKPESKNDDSEGATSALPLEGHSGNNVPWPTVSLQSVTFAPGWNPSACQPLPPTYQPLELEPDSFLMSPEPTGLNSIEWYWSEVEKRKRMEDANKEYTFAPLRVTLLNMSRLVDHILAGNQFWTPLSEEEVAVFTRLKENITDLLGEPAPPYKRTVLLTYKFTVLYDYTVLRKVYSYLLAIDDDRYDGILKQFNRFFTRGNYNMTCALFYTYLINFPSLMEVEAFSWEEYLGKDKTISCHLFLEFVSFIQGLHNPEIIFYPGYEPLDLEHFNRFSHLPVYPLGMIAGYTERADGYTSSPLEFYYHDILHSKTQGLHERISQQDTLCSGQSRLFFRQLVLDYIPVKKVPDTMGNAVELLLFELYHENTFKATLHRLKTDTYLRFMHLILDQARTNAHSFSPKYQSVTPEAAALAAFWVHTLVSFWKDKDYQVLSTKELAEEIAKLNRDIFVPKAQTILSELDFVKQNQEQLLGIISKHITEDDPFERFEDEAGDRIYLKHNADKGLGRPDIYNIELAHLYLLGTNKRYEEEIREFRSKAF